MSEQHEQRRGVTTFRGRPVTVLGPELGVGDPAPRFTVVGPDMAPVTAESLAGAVRLLSSVPSLDTPVCDLQTRRFDEAVAALDGVTVLTVSTDLPFAQARWSTAAGTTGVRLASDHRDLSFGLAHGVVVAELRLLARAVFVIDADDTVVHVEYVPAADQLPDVDAAVAAARAAAERASIRRNRKDVVPL